MACSRSPCNKGVDGAFKFRPGVSGGRSISVCSSSGRIFLCPDREQQERPLSSYKYVRGPWQEEHGRVLVEGASSPGPQGRGSGGRQGGNSARGSEDKRGLVGLLERCHT